MGSTGSFALVAVKTKVEESPLEEDLVTGISGMAEAAPADCIAFLQ